MIYYYRYLFVKMKVFNCSELHFAEVTFYKIHTLTVLPSFCFAFKIPDNVTATRLFRPLFTGLLFSCQATLLIDRPSND